MVLTLIQNVALVVMLGTAQRYLSRVLDTHPRLSTLASGVLYGSVAIAGMLTPFRFAEGIIYDGRSIVMSLAGLFGGAPVALIAGTLAGAYRVFLGGAGVVPGVATVVTSAAVGVALRRLSGGRLTSLRIIDLVAFGLAVHLLMLGIQYLLLPSEVALRVVREVGPLLLTLFPLGNAIAARMMIDQMDRERARVELTDESRRLRLAMTAADEGLWDIDLVSGRVALSAEAAQLMGRGEGPVCLTAKEWQRGMHPDDRPAYSASLGALIEGRDAEAPRVFRWEYESGWYRWYQVLGAVSDRDTAGVPLKATGVITDITEMRLAGQAVERRAVEAELLASASGRLLRARDRDEVFRIVHDFFAAVFPGDIVLVNEVDSSGDALVTRDVIGVDSDLLRTAERITGWTIKGRTYPLIPAYRKVLVAGRMQCIDGGLAEVASAEVPRAVAATLERTFGIREFWSIGIADSYVAYASIHVLRRTTGAEMPRGVVESFANLCFVTFARLFVQRLLLDSEQRFRALIEQTEQGISVGHPDGRMLVYNRAMEEISGYSREEVEQHGWFDLVYPSPEAKDRAMRLAVEAIEGGLPYVEVEITRKDGGSKWVSVATTPVVVGGETYNMSIFTDITQRRESEQELRDSEQRFRTLVETAPVAIFVQTDRRFAYANQAALHLYGASSASDLVGQPVMDRFGVGFHDAIDERIRALNEDREPQPPMEMVHVRLDGTEIDVETSGAPIVYGGKHGAVVFVRDVTEAKRAAAELERYRQHLEELVAERTRELEETNAELKRTTESKTAFFARMSHELRTPLNSIIGFSAVLKDGVAGPLTEEQAAEVGMIHSAGRHLLSIITDLLDITRAEAGRMSVDRERFGVDVLVAEVADILRPLSEEAGLDLRVVPLGNEMEIESDRMKVKRILLNLGGNAVKFTQQGHVELRVSADSAETVCFSVSDTGPGIRADLIGHIFDPFTQGDVASDAVPEGTGLGLSISRELARLLGGDVDVTSQDGVGTTFSLRLPR